MTSDPENPVAFGTWDIASWKLIKRSHLPPQELCTAVFCIPLHKDSVVLIYNDAREQWEFPGGHIEPGESLVEALCREVDEEAKLTIGTPELVGAVEVSSFLSPEAAQIRGFPHPLSYILYFKANVTCLLESPLTNEIRTRQIFSKDDATQALSKAGLQHFQRLLD